MRPLTPYDTGERLEPKPWMPGITHMAESGLSPEERRRLAFDDYGKVDFENDESATEVTIYVERADDGTLEVHVYNHGSDPLRIVTEED